jgi:hypothetical protein
MKLKYVGPIDEVVIPAFGDLVVGRGKIVELPEYATEEQAQALVESDVWEAADPATKKIAAAIAQEATAEDQAEEAPETEEVEAE